MIEALPGVLGNRVTRAFISAEQGNKCQILRGTGEQRQYWRTGNRRKQIFDFRGTGEKANLFQGNKGTGTPPPPWEGLMIKVVIIYCTSEEEHVILILLVYYFLQMCFTLADRLYSTK